MFDIFEDESFFDFFEVEHGFEEFRIFESQEMFEGLYILKFIEMSVSFEMIKKFFIEEDFAIDVLRHGGVVILNKVNDISDGIVVMEFEDMLDCDVESIF